MPTGGNNWSEANTLRFVMYVAYALGGSPREHFAAIAEKMGAEYTPTALASKWQRLRAEMDKQGGIGSASTPAKGGKKATKKSDNVAEESDKAGNFEEPSAAKGRKRKAAGGATPKGAKKAKAEEKLENEGAKVSTEVKTDPYVEIEV